MENHNSNDPFGLIRQGRKKKTGWRVRFNPRLIAIGVGVIFLVIIIVLISFRHPKSPKSTATKTNSQQTSSTNSSTQKSTSSPKPPSTTTPPTTASSTPSTTQNTAPSPATPAQDSAALSDLIKSIYSSGTASTNTCNKVVSGYTFSIDDQQTATAKATVVTQSSAGGNMIGVTFTKSADKWTISSASCS